MDKIVILDFGGQTCQLIGRRLRELGVFSEIVEHNHPMNGHLMEDLRGVILSGSPYSVYESGAPDVHESFWEISVPILGICYGFQLLNQTFGGRVEAQSNKEFGRVPITISEENRLFQDIPDGFSSWMSHGDAITELSPGFSVFASSAFHPAAACHAEKKIWGIQFHPEVSHCDFGMEILKNFAFGICKARADWSMEYYLAAESEKVRARVGNKSVLLLISGGVDSTVAGGMLLKILNPDQVHLMYVDTGLMRKNESAEVISNLETLGAKNLKVVQAQQDFFNALEGKVEPEEKRKAIGNTFIEVQEREVAQLGLEDYFLAQGTLYTDLIESGKGVGKKAQVIKSHHNVGTPLVEKKRKAGLVVEPLEMLYKDEVRALGKKLGIEESILWRHPFPGPGLGIRVIGEVTPEKCQILREADFIYIEQLKRRGLYSKIWQAFSVLLPVRSVGVTGDARGYGYVLALRAVTSKDGMSADVFDFPTKDLLEISNLITNSVKEIGRVVYDISSKPPATIEWE